LQAPENIPRQRATEYVMTRFHERSRRCCAASFWRASSVPWASPAARLLRVGAAVSLGVGGYLSSTPLSLGRVYLIFAYTQISTTD